MPIRTVAQGIRCQRITEHLARRKAGSERKRKQTLSQPAPSPTPGPEKPVLLDRFLQTASDAPSAPALHWDGGTATYSQLSCQAFRVANCLKRCGFAGNSTCVLLTGSGPVSYAGLLGILLAGGCYVPTGEHWPPRRNLSVIRQSKARFCILDPALLPVYRDLLPELEDMCIITGAGFSEKEPGDQPLNSSCSWLSCAACPGDRLEFTPSRSGNDYFYLLFTSGSTGTPKGVGITGNAVEAYFSCLAELAPVSQGERFIQLHSLTFDVAEHAMWRSLSSGGCLYLTGEDVRFMPGAFIRRHRITEMMAVPATGSMMLRMRVLRPGAFPDLRRIFFCGEALPAATAAAFCSALPEAMVCNLYGPTEVTIACLFYLVTKEKLAKDAINSYTPIGRPLPSTRIRVADSSLAPVRNGETGELLLAGSQLAPGYWDDPDKTAAAFVTADDGCVWYRTGDLVRSTGCGLCYLGRRDTMLKIRGHRVELAEVESALAKAVPSPFAVAVPRMRAGEVTGIGIFVPADCKVTDEEIIRQMGLTLPPYMLPDTIRRLESFPLNANGKIDRGRLRDMLTS